MKLLSPWSLATLPAAMLIATAAPAAPAQIPLQQSKYLRLASVTPDAARRAALAAQPGAIVAEELEKESGGSGLRYSFDIRTATDLHEVGIDARTGKLLENSIEGPDAD